LAPCPQPGVGKTRLVADLARRVYHGLPWPDGAPPCFPQGSRCLWVPSDQQHAQLAALCGEFLIPPEALLLNTSPGRLYEGTQLDSASEVKALERRIVKACPALVILDTSLNATDRGCTRPEDAKAFFVPLMQVA
jgi:hypothetical protein